MNWPRLAESIVVLVREVNGSLRGNDKDWLFDDVVPSPSDPCNVRETTEEEEEEEEEEVTVSGWQAGS